jgi:parvulin-like peptidyl-prolyl isomerase
MGELGKRLRAILIAAAREPLVHFLVIGAVIFAAIMGVRGLERPTVRLEAQDIEQLAEYWASQAQRPPTKDELRGIIQDRIDEEILAREALRLGMDKGDLIIRRRLAQKMAFASEDVGAAKEPSAAELRAAFDRNPGRYALPGKIAFRHVYFSQDRGADAAKAEAEAALKRAEAGEAISGDPSMLPLTYADAAPQMLARDYGPDFAAAVAAARPGAWTGPVRSAFGWHLVYVVSRTPGVVPPFETVESEVRANLLAERRRSGNQAFLEKLRRKYKVEIAGVPQ